MSDKDLVHFIAKPQYGGYGRHLVGNLLVGDAANQLSHVCFLECIETSFFDDDTSASNVIARAAFPAPSDPPHLYSGATLSEGQKYVTSMVDELTSIGYSIVDIGSYWYSVRLERAWPDDPDTRMAVPPPLDDDTLSWPEERQSREGGRSGGCALLFVVLLGLASLVLII